MLLEKTLNEYLHL